MQTLPGIEELERLNGQELRELFHAANLGRVPKNASLNFLRGHLAWAAQAIEAGHDPVRLRLKLCSLSQNPKPLKIPPHKPGTRLVREWQGVTHEVTIEERGFRWNGRCYDSLSRVAREITGTRWSGPRFFGLKGRHDPK